jgi:sugar O-acyltransferase (sialic acid O-acetyltransferase NeuD family)
MSSSKPIVIVGDGESAEIAYEYFTHDSNREVVAFAVERSFRSKASLFDLPVIDLETMCDRYPSGHHEAFVAMSSTHLNRPRKRLYLEVKRLGYRCASYISSRAFVWRNVEVGENSMIFENNVLQYHVRVGDNVVLWSGNHVGHRTRIQSHTFLTSHVVISGFCDIGEASFLGVNCCLADGVTVAPDTVIGMGAVVPKSITEAGRVWVGNPAKPMEKSAYEAFKVPAGERPDVGS